MPYILLFLITSFSKADGIFLIISPGARQVAMGSAFTGIADDATAMYYNPGGLAFSEDVNIGFMNPSSLLLGHPAWLPGLYSGMKHAYIGGLVPLPIGRGSLGIGYTYLSTGETIGIDSVGNEIGRWETYDYALILSYGEKVTQNLGVGVSLKYIYSFLAPDEVIWLVLHQKHGRTAKTFAFDWGMLYKTSIPGLSVGISYQNLGSEGLSYVGAGILDTIPSLVRAGLGFSAIPLLKKNLPPFILDLNFSVDLVKSLVGEKHKIWYSGGAEITLENKFSLRGGYFYDKEGKRVGITYGCGMTIRSFQIDIASDADIYDFPTSNWRAQVNFKPFHLIERKTKEND